MCRDAGWRLQEEIDREQAEQGAAPSQEETGEVSRGYIASPERINYF